MVSKSILIYKPMEYFWEILVPLFFILKLKFLLSIFKVFRASINKRFDIVLHQVANLRYAYRLIRLTVRRYLLPNLYNPRELLFLIKNTSGRVTNSATIQPSEFIFQFS